MKRSKERLSNEAIFILGISHRSGTSFLRHLMELHPDCVTTPIPEDFLLSESNDLLRFARRISKRWEPFWTEERSAEEVICEYLGKGLLAMLVSLMPEGQKKRLFTKSPTVRNLSHFKKFFPGERLLILIRDGRSVTESLVRGMRLDHEESIQRWAKGARSILDFTTDRENPRPHYLIVKYESLVRDTRKELMRIFKFLNLDSGDYDFEAAVNLPVYGSSFFQGSNPGSLNWNPVPKTPDFQSVNRWGHWNHARHNRFNWVAGKYLDAFGYQRVESGSHHFGSTLRNLFFDLIWQGRRAGKQIKKVFAKAFIHRRK